MHTPAPPNALARRLAVAAIGLIAALALGCSDASSTDEGTGSPNNAMVGADTGGGGDSGGDEDAQASNNGDDNTTGAPDAASDAPDNTGDASPDTSQPMDVAVDDVPDTAEPDVTVADDTSSDVPVDVAADVTEDIDEDAFVDVGQTPTGDFTDPFDGDGPLMGYTTNNASSLPEVARVGGRYRAEVTDNTNNITLHFNQDQGRLDAKLLTFPFDVIARNIGIGTLEDSQVAPSTARNPYLFAGVQVHVPDLDDRNSSHVVVGHRGGTHFTVEGKHTVNGDSSVNDDGANIVPAGRADIRIVGNADRTLTVYWQTPNPDPGNQADAWNLYRGTGDLPDPAPTYGPEVYVGLITYAFQLNGLPFVGTCDGLEGGSL